MIIPIILSVVLGLVVAFVTASAMQLMASDGLSYEVDADGAAAKKFTGFDQVGDGWYWAIGAGAIVGLINFFAPLVAKGALPGIALAFLIIMIALYVGMVIWWFKEGGSAKEMIPFIVLAGLMFFTTASTASAATVIIPDVFWRSVIMVIPGLLLTVSIGLMIANLFYFRYAEIDETDGERMRDLVLTIVSAAIAGLIAVALLVSGVAWGQMGANTSKAYGSVTADELNAAQAGLTVSEEEINKILSEKFKDFSDEASDESLAVNDKARVAAAGFSDALAFPLEGNTAEEKLTNLEKAIFQNSVLGVTVARAMVDKKIGDRKIGELNPWMNEMIAKDDQYGVAYWREYRDASRTTMRMTDEYRQYAAGICTLLERMKNQGVQNRTTIENWCLNAASLNNDRKGVLASYQYTKDALVLIYTAKSGAALFEIGFNVHDKRPEFFGAKIVVDWIRITGGSNKGSSPDKPDKPDKPDNPDTPDNPNTPDNPDVPDNPLYNKDKTKGSKAKPGEPDKNTNNPSDPNHSTADRPDNSTSYPSYEEYKEDMNKLEEINKDQKVGGDSNKPSTETPKDTAVDNNADKGTGNGGIDKPTETSKPAEEADTGKPINTKPGEAWGGPKD